VRPRGSPAASFELILKRPNGSVAPSEPPAPTPPSQLQRKPPLPAPRLAGPPARSVLETEVRPVKLQAARRLQSRRGRMVHTGRWGSGEGPGRVFTALDWLVLHQQRGNLRTGSSLRTASLEPTAGSTENNRGKDKRPLFKLRLRANRLATSSVLCPPGCHSCTTDGRRSDDTSRWPPRNSSDSLFLPSAPCDIRRAGLGQASATFGLRVWPFQDG